MRITKNRTESDASSLSSMSAGASAGAVLVQTEELSFHSFIGKINILDLDDVHVYRP